MANYKKKKLLDAMLAQQRNVEDGILMPIKDQKENWSECTLENGTKLRIRPVITEVRKLKQLGPDGNPSYGIKSAVITDIQHPESAKKGE